MTNSIPGRCSPPTGAPDLWEAPGFAQPGFEAPTTSGYRALTQPAGGGGGGGGGGGAANPLTAGLGGLPIVKPPYGVITALDMNSGTLKWQVPHGDTPDAVRNSPLLKGMNIPKTGQSGSVGVLIT